MAHSWSAAGYKKLSKWFWIKCDLLHFSSRVECVSAVLSPAASSLPPLCFLLCRKASSNDLPLLCRAPSAWLWAEAICRLFVPVTSAPMGTQDYFPSLFCAPECEHLRVCEFHCTWKVRWVREMVRRPHAYCWYKRQRQLSQIGLWRQVLIN